MNYHQSRRMEQAVDSLARDIGLDGDLFADPIPQLGTKEQEWTIMAIRLDVRPRPRSHDEKDFVERLARSVVLTSSPDLEPRRTTTLKQAAEDFITSELEGHEVPEYRVEWHKPVKAPSRIQRARRNAGCA